MKKDEIIIGGLISATIVLAFLIIKKKFGPQLAQSLSLPASLTGLSTTWLKPVEGKLTSGFGLRKDPLNPLKMEGHNGQDIAVPIGTQVKAPMNGVIKSTSPTTAGGNQVIMLHDNGWFTGYAHLSKVLVTVGEKVKKGDIIALSGNTGEHTTGAHLHFTMTTPAGVKVDPKPIVYA